MKLNFNKISDEKHIQFVYADSFELQNKTKSRFKGAGDCFAGINAFFLEYINGYNIPTAFKNITNKNTLNFVPNDEFLVQFKITNIVNKRSAKIFSANENDNLPVPLIEAFYNEDDNNIITESHMC